MVDKMSAVLEKYDMEITAVRKGRGSMIIETNQGMKVLKEYNGPVRKLDLIHTVLEQLEEVGYNRIDHIIRNKEGELYTKDMDGRMMVLKDYIEGRECNVKVKEEILQAVRELGKLHNAFQKCENENLTELPLQNLKEEMFRHNREIIHIYRYLKKIGDKSLFEQELLSSFPYFMDQAKGTLQELGENSCLKEINDENVKKCESNLYSLCHGDYQYHNVILHNGEVYVTNFEKVGRGGQVRDLYLFLRKVLEKYNWSVYLAEEMLDNYQNERQLVDYERKELYDRVRYPEKFWKIANFYMNSRKSWQPERNREKLQRVLSQEADKVKVLSFLENYN